VALGQVSVRVIRVPLSE